MIKSLNNFINKKTGEQIIPKKFESKEEYLLYLRHLFAYYFAKDNILENSAVLEVGCGEGYGTFLLQKKFKKIIGLDVDKNIVAHASKKYGSENCIFRVYDGLKLPYKDDTFDAVISFQVIEHIQDDINYISEIYRILKRNGIFLLTTPNRTYRLKPGQKPWNRFHIREYYLHELENILKNKFLDIKVWGIRGDEEVQRIETERVKQGLGINSFVLLNLRKIIPETLKPVIIKILRRIIHRNQRSKNKRYFLNKYSLKNYYIIKSNLRDSLDFLAICKK